GCRTWRSRPRRAAQARRPTSPPRYLTALQPSGASPIAVAAIGCGARRGGSELVRGVLGREDLEFGLALDTTGLHELRDHGVAAEELLERLGVGPLVDDHDMVVAEAPTMVERTRCLGVPRHRFEVRLALGPQLLDVVGVDGHTTNDDDAHGASRFGFGHSSV